MRARRTDDFSLSDTIRMNAVALGWVAIFAIQARRDRLSGSEPIVVNQFVR
jgi:hypothetical protein